nr:hypothetical protein [Mycobacterium ulcerans]
MGSGGQTAAETVTALTERGERVGVAQIRLYRPFSGRGPAGGPAPDGPRDRGPGPHQGTRIPRRATVFGCHRRPGRGL